MIANSKSFMEIKEHLKVSAKKPRKRDKFGLREDYDLRHRKQ